MVGTVIGYIYFMREKKSHLQKVLNGVCPKCHEESIELVDQRSTGCSNPTMLTFKCNSCDYINTFNISNESC